MNGRQKQEDELARRRVARGPSNRELDLSDEGEEEHPKLGWRDTLALIIAAYQLLFPMLLAMVGALVLVYLLFQLVFS